MESNEPMTAEELERRAMRTAYPKHGLSEGQQIWLDLRIAEWAENHSAPDTPTWLAIVERLQATIDQQRQRIEELERSNVATSNDETFYRSRFCLDHADVLYDEWELHDEIPPTECPMCELTRQQQRIEVLEEQREDIATERDALRARLRKVEGDQVLLYRRIIVVCGPDLIRHPDTGKLMKVCGACVNNWDEADDDIMIHERDCLYAEAVAALTPDQSADAEGE